MTEAEIVGSGRPDLAAAKRGLSSSSTTLRLAHLRTLEERLTSHGWSRNFFSYGRTRS